MAEKEEKILYICTHAGEDPEKAAMPFVMANAAMTMDIKTTDCAAGNRRLSGPKRLCGNHAAGRWISTGEKTDSRFHGSGRKAAGLRALHQGTEHR